MSEQKEFRPLAAIEQEYQQLCLQGGNIQYQIACFTEDLAKINQRQKEVNQEGHAFKLAQQAALATVAEEVALPAPSENN